jgi:hypothetical protein
MNINQRIRILFKEAKLFIQNFNLFPSVPPSNDEYQLRNQRISTRLFIFLLTLSLSILLLYTSLINVTQTVTVKTPTITQYLQMHSAHSQTLTCPCTTISIDYDKILYVQYTFHQVCNSVFVTKYWTDYLYIYTDNTVVFVDDFRWTATFTFQALTTFCDLINQTISNRLIQFYSTQYISASVTSSQLFQSQIESLISEFISSMTNDFLLSLLTIRDTTQSNGLVTGQLSNYQYLVSSSTVHMYPTAASYDNCSCEASATCVYQSRIYDHPDTTILFFVPGIYVGCYVIESLLQSDLRCFYNQTCINEIQSYFLSYSSMNITALDKSLLIRFFENSTIEELVEDLMVEQWNSSQMYESYYNQCQPSQCTYTHETKNSDIYIITTLVGLIGGLTTALKLIVPRLVKLIAFCIRKCRVRRTRVMPFIQT